jgi:hypothetical protein
MAAIAGTLQAGAAERDAIASVLDTLKALLPDLGDEVLDCASIHCR